jgi:hypothetical protein
MHCHLYSFCRIALYCHLCEAPFAELSGFPGTSPPILECMLSIIERHASNGERCKWLFNSKSFHPLEIFASIFLHVENQTRENCIYTRCQISFPRSSLLRRVQDQKLNQELTNSSLYGISFNPVLRRRL